MNNQNPDTELSEKDWKDNLLSILTSIGGLRDALIVGAGTIYILGYMTWSISAYQNGLGLLPALDAQYFMAGLVPAFILILILFIFFNLITLNNMLHRVFGSEKTVLNGVFRSITNACVVITLIFTFAVYLISFFTWIIEDDKPDITHLSFYEEFIILLMDENIAFSLIFGVVLVFTFVGGPYTMLDAPVNTLRKPRNNILSFLRHYQSRVQLIYLVIMVAGIGITSYGSYFKNLPQEFGGIGKRCAYLDIHRDTVSLDSFEKLRAPSLLTTLTHDPNSKVVNNTTNKLDFDENRDKVVAQDTFSSRVFRSRKVDVIFQSSNVILIQVDESRLEVKPDVVSLISWCDK